MAIVWFMVAAVMMFGFTALFGAPYVPTQRKYLREALTKLYKVGKKDVLLDLGSGDGIVLKEANRLGAKAIGYELNPLLVLISRLRTGKQAKIYLRNMWSAQFPADVTVVYVFSDGRDVRKLALKLQSESKRLGRGFTVISYGFKLPGLELRGQTKGHYCYFTDKKSTSIMTT